MAAATRSMAGGCGEGVTAATREAGATAGGAGAGFGAWLASDVDESVSASLASELGVGGGMTFGFFSIDFVAPS